MVEKANLKKIENVFLNNSHISLVAVEGHVRAQNNVQLCTDKSLPNILPDKNEFQTLLCFNRQCCLLLLFFILPSHFPFFQKASFENTKKN